MTGLYKIADKTIEIISLHKRVHDYCKDYHIEGIPDFTVTITQPDIDYEKIQSAKTCAAEGKTPIDSPDDYLEELAVYRKIAEKMPEYDTFLFHGSAIAVDGQTYLFTAKSSTGKSTHSKLWRMLLGERAVMVNDDKPLIRVNNNGITVFGTPYNGKHRLGNNISLPLKAICILEQSAENHIKRINKKEAYTILLQQTYRPSDILALTKTLSLVDKMANSVEIYKLGCNMDISAAELSYNTMKGQQS
ncbi:MAG: hypothetical protein IIY78_10040 [Clostridia bacterium]|nr:hypothetical protein [Clostridia bacterium]